MVKEKKNNFIIAKVKKAELRDLMFDEDIVSIEEYVEPEPCSDHNFSTLATSAYNPGPVPWNAASGINVATYETGIWQTLFNCKNLTAAQIDINNNAIPHSQQCFLALMNAALGASYWHRHSLSFAGQDEQDFIVDNNIRNISRSYTNSTDPNTNEFRIMDDFAYRYPYPLFSNPTANSGYDLEVNWQCYNHMSVGNVRYTNSITYEMDGCTQARNPDPVYGSCVENGMAPCAGDREMPYIVAPGHHPNTSGNFTDNCLSDWRACGTSYSAPTLSGMAACVRSANSSFNTWPEAVRVALMVTAVNVHGGYWNSSEDGYDGAGVVSGNAAVAFANNATRVYPDMTTGVVNGYAATSWYNTQTTARKFQVKIPWAKPSGKHLRIVLTWDSRPDLTNATNQLSDLDITGFRSDSRYYHSTSWDSNVEMIDVPRSELTANATYDFWVSPYAIRLPSGTTFFYYAVGWTWVED